MPINQAEAQAVTLAFVRDYPGALYGHRAAEVPADLKGGYVPKETIHNGRAYRGRVDVPLANMDAAADLTLRHEVLGHYAGRVSAGPRCRGPGQAYGLIPCFECSLNIQRIFK